MLSNKLENWAYHNVDTFWGYLFWPIFLADIIAALLGVIGL